MMINDDVWCFLPKGLQQYLQDRGFGGQYKKAVLGELTMSYNPEGEITPFEDYEWGYSAVLKNGNDWIAVVKKWSMNITMTMMRCLPRGISIRRKNFLLWLIICF